MGTRIRYPDGHVLLRNLARDYPIVSHGDGIYLYDTDGKRYVDASSGALVASVGHGNREVAAQIGEQLARVGYVNGTQFTSEATEALADRLVAIAARELPAAQLERCAFLSSGSEIVEAAVKFVRQLWVERGQPRREKFVARMPSYHGNTLYALSLSGRPHYKRLYGPMLSEVVTTAAPYPYRTPVDDYERDGAAYLAAELEKSIQAAGPDTIAGFLVEPVGGSSTGAAVPPPGYFQAVREVCDRHGILVIADEILCGSGRTGAFFASSLYGFAPDVLVLGKGLGGGLAPVSCLMVRTDHVEEIRRGSGYFQHAQTYLQAPSMTAAGVATLDYFERHGLVEHARRMGELLQRRLREVLLPLHGVGSVQGVGLLAGVELVADKATKAPFPRKQKLIERLVARLFDAGVIVWPNVGQADGENGDLFMIGPPLPITEVQVDELVSALARTIFDFMKGEGG